MHCGTTGSDGPARMAAPPAARPTSALSSGIGILIARSRCPTIVSSVSLPGGPAGSSASRPPLQLRWAGADCSSWVRTIEPMASRSPRRRWTPAHFAGSSASCGPPLFGLTGVVVGVTGSEDSARHGDGSILPGACSSESEVETAAVPAGSRRAGWWRRPRHAAAGRAVMATRLTAPSQGSAAGWQDGDTSNRGRMATDSSAAVPEAKKCHTADTQLDQLVHY